MASSQSPLFNSAHRRVGDVNLHEAPTAPVRVRQMIIRKLSPAEPSTLHVTGHTYLRPSRFLHCPSCTTCITVYWFSAGTTEFYVPRHGNFNAFLIRASPAFERTAIVTRGQYASILQNRMFSYQIKRFSLWNTISTVSLNYFHSQRSLSNSKAAFGKTEDYFSERSTVIINELSRIALRPPG